MFELPTNRPDLIIVAGDWHADAHYAVSIVRQAGQREIDTILHLGDFCLYPNYAPGARFLDLVEQECSDNDVTIWVTPGNHEDWAWIDHQIRTHPDREFDEVRPHINVLRRGARFTVLPFNSHVFASLGGAPSVNIHDLTPNVDWFPTEIYTMGDIQRLINDGSVDVLLAHDVCNGSTVPVERMLAHNPYNWPQDALEYAAGGRQMLDAVREELKPKVWLHGHYHVSATEQRDQTIFVALAANYTAPKFNTALIDMVNPSVFHNGIEFQIE